MLVVNGISFAYQEKQVLKDVSLELPKGNHLAIMGESGSGKSTLIKAIYGLLDITQGSIFWNGNKVMGPRFQLIAGEQKMKLVTQEPDLMPFITVGENVETHLSAFNKEEHQDRVDELLALVGLTEFKNVRADRLSGGQKQRVALAKAIAEEPEVLILDEPFSNIDQFLKHHLRLQFFSNLKERGITLITASHDAEDVIPFADYLLVIKAGEVIGFDHPKLLFDKPVNKYMASLFGYVNEVPIKLFKEYSQTDSLILIYPHEFQLSSSSGAKVFVVNNHFKGSHYLIEAVSEEKTTIYFNQPNALKIHSAVYLNVSLNLINKRMQPKIPAT